MKKPYIISVSANAGGGKTTITRELCNRLSNAKAVYFDDYEYEQQPDSICEWVENGADPSAWDLSIFVNKIQNIIDNESVDYVVLDYPFGKQDYPVKDFIDMTVFIDTPLDVTLARRIIRDYKNVTVQDIIGELNFYLERSRPCYVAHGDDMRSSDLVIDGTLTINKIIENIVLHIKQYSCAE